MLHYLLPFVILGIIIFHVLFLHESGSSTGRGARDREFKIKFFPYLVSKDLINLCFFGGFFLFNSLLPLILGDCENLKEANLISSPVHIQPE